MKKKKKKEKKNTHKTETDNGTRKKIELSRKVDKSTTISFAHLFFFCARFLILFTYRYLVKCQYFFVR